MYQPYYIIYLFIYIVRKWRLQRNGFTEDMLLFNRKLEQSTTAGPQSIHPTMFLLILQMPCLCASTIKACHPRGSHPIPSPSFHPVVPPRRAPLCAHRRPPRRAITLLEISSVMATGDNVKICNMKRNDCKTHPFIYDCYLNGWRSPFADIRYLLFCYLNHL